MKLSKRPAALAVAVSCALRGAPAAADDAETLRQMKEQLARMQSQIEAMEQRLEEQELEPAKVATQVAQQQGNNENESGKAVRVYGEARVSVDHRSGDWPTGSEGTEIVSNASRLGVEGEMGTTLKNTSLFY